MILGVFAVFFVVGVPLWFLGLSAFAVVGEVISGELRIDEIGLGADVASVEIVEGELATPERLVGAYRREEVVFLYGHSTGVFRELSRVEVGDEVVYVDEGMETRYVVDGIEVMARDRVGMGQLLSGEAGELVLMTCAGDLLEDGDYSERLIVYASTD